MSKKELAIQDKHVISKIYMIRSHKVMLDMDLAELYGVETGHLKRAVRRNMIRFPDDFIFELNAEELESLRCQIGISIPEKYRNFPSGQYVDKNNCTLRVRDGNEWERTGKPLKSLGGCNFRKGNNEAVSLPERVASSACIDLS